MKQLFSDFDTYRQCWICVPERKEITEEKQEYASLLNGDTFKAVDQRGKIPSRK